MANNPHVVDERRARIRSPRSGFAIDQPPPPAASAPLIDMHDLAQVTAQVHGYFGRSHPTATSRIVSPVNLKT